MILWFLLGLWPISADAAGIVTLAPSLAEVVAEILPKAEWHRIVGVSDYTDFPKELRGRPSVGSFAKFNVETVVSLKPDLVLATTDGNPKERVDRLQALGLKVLVVDTGSLEQIEESFRILGRALSAESNGEALAQEFHQRIAGLRKRWFPPMIRPRVLLQLGSEPLVVVGGKGFLSQAIEAIGAANIYAADTQAYPRPSLEDVLVRKPDAIFVLTMGSDRAFFERQKREWERFHSLSAVKRGQVDVFPGDELARPSSRLLAGIAALQRRLFPWVP